MAIAPSKLGRLVNLHAGSDRAFLRALREAGLVKPEASDDQLRAVLQKARDEHAALDRGAQAFNSPNERVRVFLAPYLTEKGQQWAVPLSSLDLPDDVPARKPWWRFW